MLMRGDHITQRIAIIQHVIPGERRTPALLGKTAQAEIGYQPGRVLECANRRAPFGRQFPKHFASLKHRGGPDHDARQPPHRAVLIRVPGIHQHRPIQFRQPPNQGVGDQMRRQPFPQLVHQPAVAFRPGQHIIAARIAGQGVAAGEIVNPHPRRGFIRAAAVVIAAGVVDVPVQ